MRASLHASEGSKSVVGFDAALFCPLLWKEKSPENNARSGETLSTDLLAGQASFRCASVPTSTLSRSLGPLHDGGFWLPIQPVRANLDPPQPSLSPSSTISTNQPTVLLLNGRSNWVAFAMTIGRLNSSQSLRLHKRKQALRSLRTRCRPRWYRHISLATLSAPYRHRSLIILVSRERRYTTTTLDAARGMCRGIQEFVGSQLL